VSIQTERIIFAIHLRGSFISNSQACLIFLEFDIITQKVISLSVWFLHMTEVVRAEDVPILIQNRNQSICDNQMYLS